MKETNQELVILVNERVSMAKALIRFERMGIDVTDVLPFVRALIIKPTDKQLKNLLNKDYLWNNKINMKKSFDVSFE